MKCYIVFVEDDNGIFYLSKSNNKDQKYSMICDRNLDPIKFESEEEAKNLITNMEWCESQGIDPKHFVKKFFIQEWVK